MVEIMDREVKKEVEKEEALCSPLDSASKSALVMAEEEENVTLAQLLQTPKHEASSPKGNTRQTREKNEKLSKVEKRLLDWKIKHAITGPGGKLMSFEQNNAANGGLCSPGEFKSSAVIRALEVRANLQPEFPSFVKSLVRSHVASCFWMGLPGAFCKSYLPDKDVPITLDDESGNHYQVKYIAYKTGLSAGWRQFSVAHKLLEGDALVFQLLKPTKFKVYIIRANDLTEVDGALGLLHLDIHTKQNDADQITREVDNMGSGIKNRKRLKHDPIAAVEKKTKAVPIRSVRKQSPERHENESEEINSDVLGGFKFSGPMVPFQDIKNFEDFHIVINGISIDSELPEDTRKRYFKLCRSQNAFLHENFMQGINQKLIIGTISEITSIADAIRASNLETSEDEFAAWGKTLRAFQLFGMNIGFLQTRLHRIVSFAYESEEATEARRYIQGRTERDRAEDEIRSIEEKLEELKEACSRFDAVVENLNSKVENYELKFLEEVKAPW